MFQTACEFGVELPPRAEVGATRFAIDGRCFKGVVRPGTEFDLRFRYVTTADAPSVPTGEELIRVAVERIEMYARDVPELNEGCAARLFLSCRRSLAKPLDVGDVLATSSR